MEKLKEIFSDKLIKPKDKTEQVSKLFLDGQVTPEQMAAFAGAGADTVKATCLEAMEYATKIRPEAGDGIVFDFARQSLGEKAPRVKWESARIIGNIIHQHPSRIPEVLEGLYANARHSGTVVRWSAAYAIGQVIKVKSRYNNEILREVKEILAGEEKNSIRKIYLDAMKKL